MGPQFLTSLSRRRRQAELMDQDGLGETEHACCFAGAGPDQLAESKRRDSLAARLRSWRRAMEARQSASSTWLAEAETCRSPWRNGLDERVCAYESKAVTSADEAVRFARRQAAAKRPVPLDFSRSTFSTSRLPTGYDVVTSSLFLHHLDEANAVLVLAKGRRRDRPDGFWSMISFAILSVMCSPGRAATF